jgi:hypothetical protein
MSEFDEKMKRVDRLYASAREKIDRLRKMDPYLIDLSLRENPAGDRVGQTLKQKLDLLPKLRAFGFTNILLGTLDYAIPDELEVDDDFMAYLRDNQIDMTGGFAFTATGIFKDPGGFEPDTSMIKLQSYGVPNTLHEIYLSDRGMRRMYDIETLRRSLPCSIEWLNQNIRGDDGGKPRILINIVDGCDAFIENPERTCSVMQLLAEQPIEGISIEDGRGTHLPLQVGAVVAMARTFLPPPLKILVHMHAGGGFENASVIEALLSGADGAWGGLPKSAAIIGHASLGELIANLVRVGNAKIRETYQLDELLPFATALQRQDQEQPVPNDYPILGSNAYRLTLSFFKQIEGRFMDLPPSTIGGKYGYRVVPVVSDPPVLAGRLAEVTSKSPGDFPCSVLVQMIRLMRQDQRAGKLIAYDEPGNLLALYERAKASDRAVDAGGTRHVD